MSTNKKHVTPEQKSIILAFMLGHKDLAQEKLNGNKYKKEFASFSISNLFA